ncbi:MAG TPA: Na-translocating system protein MpsC family protein, partial [Armatimonadota bacterium]|nr:Na-translocating system protein MpsC family protein [Armatimonadota bacterium]
TEAKLAVTEEGRRLIKSARQEMRSISRGEIESAIGEILGCKVLRSYCDVEVDAAEEVEVYVLECDVERRLLRQDLDRLSGLAPRRGT